MKYTQISVLMSPATSAVVAGGRDPHLTSFENEPAIQFGDERWRFTLACADSAQVQISTNHFSVAANAPSNGEW